MARQGTERVHRVRPQAMFALKTSCENFDNTVFPNAMIAGDCVITHLLGRLDYLKTGKCKVMVVDTFHLFDETMPFLASIEKEYGFKAEIFGPVDVLPIQPIYYPSTTPPPPHLSPHLSRHPSPISAPPSRSTSRRATRLRTTRSTAPTCGRRTSSSTTKSARSSPSSAASRRSRPTAWSTAAPAGRRAPHPSPAAPPPLVAWPPEVVASTSLRRLTVVRLTMAGVRARVDRPVRERAHRRRSGQVQPDRVLDVRGHLRLHR